MDVFDAIYGLRATRVYDDRPIPPDVLTRILEAGTRACSSGNTQPWELVVVVDSERKQYLKKLLADAFATIDEQRAQPADQLVDGVGRPVTGHAAVDHVDVVGAIVFAFWNPDRGVRMKNEYEENPDGTLRQTRPIPGGRGSSIFPLCQNMMLAAHALGVQSLFTTFFGLVEREVKELLHVPPRMFLESAVFLGYGAEPLGKPRRKPLDEVAHLDDWNVAYDPKASSS
ncbi:MAG TPA: nitroreductase family protein [Acidimicrobiia bacterium]|nr:nitroreductase family protein [Acidimicrobiia bacterium]